MEDQKSVHGFFLALACTCTGVALGLSIYFGNFYIFLGWLAGILLFFVVCRVLALFNLAMFAPIIWLIDRFAASSARRRRSRERTAKHD